MKRIKPSGNVIKFWGVSAGWRMSKAGLLKYTGFDKLTLTAFLNC